MNTRRHEVSQLKQILWDKQVSQSQLAADTGISYVYLNRIINGWVVPSRKTQSLISKYLDVTPAEIFNNKNNSELNSGKGEVNYE